MKLKTFVLLGAVLVGTLSTTAVMAKPHQGMNVYRILLSEKGSERLDLTLSQQNQIKTIAESEKQALATYKEKGKETKQALQSLVKAPSFDEIAFRQALTEGQHVRTEVAVLKAKNKNRIWNLLTAEQQSKLEKIKEKMRKKMKMRRKGKLD